MIEAGHRTMTGLTRIVIGLICLGLLSARPATADEGLLTKRRGAGLLFMGAGVALVKQGFEFRDEADDFYSRYKQASDADQIERLYQHTNNRDIKSQLSWALAGACTVAGLRLIFSQGAEPPPARQAVRSESRTPRLPGGLELTSRLAPERVELALSRRFF